MEFRGTYTALVTPFDRSGVIDADAFDRLLEYQISGCVSGVVLFGSTGEGVTVSHEERVRFIERAVDLVAGRTQVIIGAGGSSTQQVIEETRTITSLGIDGLMVSTPPYNKPSQAGLFAHFHAVADATHVPVMLYNIPGRTAAVLEPTTTLRLAQHPKVRAVKEAAGLGSLQEILRGVPEDFAVFAGDDDLALPSIALGAVGLVSVVSNQAPAHMVALIDAALSGDLDEARRRHYELLPLFESNFVETNPMPVKAGLAAMGLIEDVLRLPLVSAAPETRRMIAEQLRALDIPFAEDSVQ